MGVGCILNKQCEPSAPLALIPGGKVHKAGDGWIRQESVERIPIAQDKVSQDKPLSCKGRHLLSRFPLVCFRSPDHLGKQLAPVPAITNQESGASTTML